MPTYQKKKPTLLSINNYFYQRGGAEFVFLEQNKLLEDIGWNIIPFAMKHPKNYETKWSQFFVDEIEFGEQYSTWEKIKRVPKVIYSLEAQKKITRLINETRPDICHAHNIYHHISPSILPILKKHNIPTLLTLHDLKLACPSYKMLTHDGICERCKNGNIFNVVRHKCVKDSTALSLIAYVETAFNRMLESYTKNVDRFIVPSKFFLTKFTEWGFNPDQLEYIPNFIDTRKYFPDFSVGKRYVYFGRLSKDKGLYTLLKAAKQANIGIDIIGTGIEEQAIQQLSNTLKVDAKFLGYHSGDSLHEKIRNAKCVILPSELYENAPISIMEAYALGKPVIGARIGGIPELIQENKTGLCFESGSVDSLANTIIHMEEKKHSDIETMGRLGHQWMDTEFSAKDFRNRLIGLYSSLINQS